MIEGGMIQIAEKAQYRLHKRYWRLITAGKHRNQVVVAVARELVGFIWAMRYPASIKNLEGPRQAAA